jgi:transcriptional regulator of arginine metabolism
MPDSRTRRQKALAEMIRAEALASQEEVTERLRAAGFAVTQATVSRDLVSLGAVKVKRGGAISYALPDQIGETDWAAARLGRIFAEWVQRTPPGSAHLVGLALDQAQLAEIAGTISGDDTIFIAVRDGADVEELTQRFRRLSGG